MTRWTDEQVTEYLRKFKSDNRVAGGTAELEPDPRYAAKEKAAAKKAHPRYRLEISYRAKRRADPGNRCYKFAVDGLVQARILGDDTWEWITEIKETEEKGKVEQTVIKLYEIVES